jgi:hypothetical protein
MGRWGIGSGRLVIQRSSRKTLSTVSLLPLTIVTNTINPIKLCYESSSGARRPKFTVVTLSGLFFIQFSISP